jgi:N-acetylglutamate synthase-like GNAT family acetyltransferase
MRRQSRSSLAFAEKEFYLDEFHEKSLLFALHGDDLLSESNIRAASEVFGTLLRNQSRVLLLIESSDRAAVQQRIAELHKSLARAAKATHSTPLSFSAEETVDQVCMRIWEVLRETRLCIGLWPAGATASLEGCAQSTAVRLRVYKLVYVDPLGGLIHDGKILSFLTGPGLQDLLQAGPAGMKDLAARRRLLEAIRRAMEGGIVSVSLCSLENLGRELFTYEGCGTMFTRGDYCQVEKLGIDDFHEIEKLLHRAERAGYLKPRTPLETTLLLLHGYGARLGPADMEPAGFCALFPFPDDNAAEIVGLFTITRYKGEGVGNWLVEAMVREGGQQGLAYIFACTNQETAQRLFERHEFRRVLPEAVAAAKWQGYDPERQRLLTVYRRDLK